MTDQQLREALRAAGETIPLPEGAAAILDAAAPSGNAPEADPATPDREPLTGATRFPRRRGAYLAGSVAAVAAAAVLLILLLPSAAPPPHLAALPPRALAGSAGTSSGSSLPAFSGARLPSSAVPAPASAAGNAAVGAASLGKSSSAPAIPAGKQPAKVTSSGTLALVVPRAVLEKDARALGTLAVGAGGYVASTKLAPGSHAGSATVVLSIPAGSFQSLIAAAEHLGTLASLTTNNKDVTSQYSDTAAQLQALGAVRTQLERLLQRAAKVSDLLDVENQIQQVQTQIDELEGQQRLLNSEISYARLTVELSLKGAVHHVPPKKSSLERAWSAAVSGFLGGLRWLLSVSGRVLFVLLVGLALLFGTRGFLRHLLPRLRRLFL